MSKLILHVGTHKTATTSIQNILALNRKMLAKHGFIFPKLGTESGQHGLVTDWITLPPQYQYEEGSVSAWKTLVRDYANTDKTVFVSSEEFSRGDPKQRINLADIRELCSEFDEFQVICCIRNQVSFLQSIYLQVAKSTVAVPWVRLYERALSHRMATGVLMDFNWLYGHLKRGFAPEEISFFVYDQAIRRPDGIIGEIMDLAGYGHLTSQLSALSAGDSNVSQDPLTAWASAQISIKQSSSRKLLNVTRSVLEQHFREGVKTTVYSEAEVARMISFFEPLNTAFEEDIRKTGHDLKITWPNKDPNLVHRNRVPPAFWIKLARRMYDENPKLH
ncbi:hypothetical protein [Primorskyibacter flagellatus]|uniref:hypothetical protein n=1 Tax=Primorskyibacter flagellatus TaxID=1387277 RepID=UPI003A8ED30F